MPEPVLPPARYEHTDASPRAALIAFPAILAGLLLSVLLVWWIYPGDDRRSPPAVAGPALSIAAAAVRSRRRHAEIPRSRTGQVEQRRLGRSGKGHRPHPDRRRDAPHRRLRHPGLAEMIAARLAADAAVRPARPARQPTCSAFAYDQHPGAQLPLTAPFKDASGHAVTLGQALAHRPADPGAGLFPLPEPVWPGSRRPDECVVPAGTPQPITAWSCCRSTRRRRRPTHAPPSRPTLPASSRSRTGTI